MSTATLARVEWKRWLDAPAAGASDVGRSLAEAAGWRLVSALGHFECRGWTYDRRTGLTCSCGVVLDEPEGVQA